MINFSMDFIHKIYSLLTSGNEQIYFQSMCIQNQNRENATNNPIAFGIQLIKINILCSLPVIRKIIFKEKPKNQYLSRIFIRPEICETASGMLDNQEVIFEVFDCAFASFKSDEEIYRQIECNHNLKGFVILRKRLENSDLSIQQIYIKINSAFNTNLDYNEELELIEACIIPNRYIVRLLDIACWNNLRITAYANKILPHSFIKKLLDKYSIHCDDLIIDKSYKKILKENEPKKKMLLSSNFKMIKSSKNIKYFYYKNPNSVCKNIKVGLRDKRFERIYNFICGRRLFSGVMIYSKEYETGYMYLGAMMYICKNTNTNIEPTFHVLLNHHNKDIYNGAKDFINDFKEYCTKLEIEPSINKSDAQTLYNYIKNSDFN